MTLGSHQNTIGNSQAHITPRRILDPLGVFETDPCAADPRPWDCARINYAEADDGLKREWVGRAWLNPPFHRYLIGSFINRMVAHGHGTALVHARTETEWFQPIWDAAHAVLFLAGRVIFCKADGTPQTISNPKSKHYGKPANSGAPVVLIAFGTADADVLAYCGLAGKFVPLRIPRSVVIEAIDASWRQVVVAWLRQQRGPVRLDEIYRAFADHPKSKKNRHWQAKLRQTLQRAAERTGRGEWKAAA